MTAQTVWPAGEGRDGAFAAAAHAATHVVRVRVLAGRWGNVCDLCGDEVDLELTKPHPGAPEADHIIPLGAPTFGARTWANLRLVHAFCNNARRGGDVAPQQRRAEFRQRCADFADRVFWFAQRALHAEGNVRRAVRSASDSDFPETFESEIASSLKVVFGNLEQLERSRTDVTFDPAAPERYDVRLEGLRPWSAFCEEVASAAGDAHSVVDGPADLLESGAVLPAYLLREMREAYGPDWEDAIADQDDLLGYDEDDADGLPLPHGTGDEYDGGFGPDSYFAHSMQKDD